LLGFRSDKDILQYEMFRQFGDVYISTEDGSLGEPAYIYFQICHFSFSILKIGPSLHTQVLPSIVSSTQQRHAPTPQAIIFSRDTSQDMFRS